MQGGCWLPWIGFLSARAWVDFLRDMRGTAEQSASAVVALRAFTANDASTLHSQSVIHKSHIIKRTILMTTQTTYSSPRDTVGTSRVANPWRVTWGAVFAGALIAISIQVLLSMLGTGIGASTVDTQANGGTPSASAFGIGAGLWWVISSLLALFIGGWVAGRLSGSSLSADAALHGLLTWALAMMATLYLIGTAAGSLVSGAAGLVSGAASATATIGAAAAPKIADAASQAMSDSGVSFDSIKRDAMQLLSQTGKPELQPDAMAQRADNAASTVKQAAANPPADGASYSALLDRLLNQGKQVMSAADRQALVNIVAARTGVSQEEASKRVAGWEATAQQARDKASQAAEQAKQKALEVANATAQGVSRAMLFGCLAFALGAVAAWWGGAAGMRKAMVVRGEHLPA